MMTNSGITIYNKYLDPVTRADAYNRVFIPAVFFTGLEASMRAQAGANKDDKVFISIPFVELNVAAYLDPLTYKKTQNRTGYFTLAPGDRLVKGDTGFDITGPASELDKKFETYTITSVSTRDYGSPHLRHWAVTAK